MAADRGENGGGVPVARARGRGEGGVVMSRAAVTPSRPKPGAGAGEPRPVLAVICEELTPYRVHFHRRIAAEIPELRLASLLTWDSVLSPWKNTLDGDPALNIVRFGEGSAPDKKIPAKFAPVERESAKRVVEWLGSHNVGAVMSLGYHRLQNLEALRWCRREGVPCMLWADSNVHGDPARGLRRIAKKLLLPRVLRRFTNVMVCGRLGRDYYKRYGVPENRIIFSPYEPDYAQIAGLPSSAVEDAKRKFGLREGRRRVMCCSRLAPVKRVDLSIDAFAAIADERPGWDLVIAGDGPLRDELKARVPERLRDRVIWTGFIGQQEVVGALYRACDVLLHAAEYEPWALVINEAVASGMAVVATDVVGAAYELVRDGVNGRLVAAKDLAALTDALRDVTDPANVDRMRAASAGVLADWRRRADPVAGLRAALAHAGVLAGAGAGASLTATDPM